MNPETTEFNRGVKQMKKINQEEYEFLKGLHNMWKWIAREEDRGLYAFIKKPVKKSGRIRPSYWDAGAEWSHPVLELIDEIHLFQFIQWTDEEPYNIAELIEEYESEETEVKKQELIEKRTSDIEAAEFYGKGKEDKLIEYMRDFVDDLNQLDEPEVLSQELPVIPKFVAEFLIGKEDYMLYELLDGEWLYEEHDRVAKWLYDNDELTNKQREIDLVMAHDRGYLVGEEPLYRARLKVLTEEFTALYLRSQSSDAEDRLKTLEIGSKYLHEDYRHLSEFTEDELKRFDIWDNKQWELEEVEE